MHFEVGLHFLLDIRLHGPNDAFRSSHFQGLQFRPRLNAEAGVVIPHRLELDVPMACRSFHASAGLSKISTLLRTSDEVTDMTPIRQDQYADLLAQNRSFSSMSRRVARFFG
jgi:hypothetical protein